MSEFSKAKQALLASGLPLEMSVEGLLRSMRFHGLADFSYWRRADPGHKDFSVDVRATRHIPTPWLAATEDGQRTVASITAMWDILVECKYRSPSVKWVFAPLAGPYSLRRTHFFMNGRGHCALGDEAGALMVVPSMSPGTPGPDKFPVLVTRGIELRSGGANTESDDAYSSSIRRGIYQLQFAHFPRLNGPLHSVGRLRDVVDPPYLELSVNVSSLVLVTTAELWAFRADIDFRAIERAESLSEIANRVDAVEYPTVVSRELRNHNEEWLTAMQSTLNKTLLAQPDKEDNEPRRELWKRVGDIARREVPSVLIVHYDSLEHVLTTQAAVIEARLLDMTQLLATARGLVLRRS